MNLRRTIGVIAAAMCLSLTACSRKQEVKVKTPDQIKAEIQKVQNDPKMPPNVKGMVLGLLNKELAQSEKVAQRK
mgnify:CR=1 FL=1